MTRSRWSAVAVAVAAVLTLPAATSTTTPNDPLFPVQWGPQQVNAPAVWPTTSGAGTLIAIVDTGVDLDHEDLAANVVRGNTFLDCGDSGCGDGDWQSGDDAGHPHGTHVAGIAAAVGDNATGIVGVAPDASILPVKVLDEFGTGTFEDIARGIRYAADQGADVINLSLGAYPGVQTLEIAGVVTDARDAIAYARERGSVVVVAAGNEAFPLCASPSFNDGALCVAATDRREVRAAYSNWPIKPDLLAVSAPGGSSALVICGEDIVSTVPAGEGGTYCDYPENAAYAEYAGTSMAAPHVAGVAALLVGLGCSEAETVGLLTSTARNPLTGARGTWDPVYGYGIVDAATAVAAAACTDGGGATVDGGDGGGNGNGGGKDKDGDGKPGNGGGKPPKA